MDSLKQLKSRVTGHYGNCLMCNEKIWIYLSDSNYGRGKYCSKKCSSSSKIGTKFSDEHRKKISNKLVGRVSPTLGMSRPKQSIRMSSYNNPNWQGGKSFELYCIGWNRTFKEQIRRRDNYKCFICLKPESECIRNLDVHHIDYNKKNIDEHNLISLCVNCHVKTNYNRDKWKAFFEASLWKA